MAEFHQLGDDELSPEKRRKGCVARVVVTASVSALLVGAVFLLGTWPEGGQDRQHQESALQTSPSPFAAPPPAAVLRLGGEKHVCPTACRKDDTTLVCRACANKLSVLEFCYVCKYQGLNDLGCRSCPDSVAATMTLLPESLEDAVHSLASVISHEDAHGCLPRAGYRWCAAMLTCIRPWQRGIITERAFTKRCNDPHSDDKPHEAGIVVVGKEDDLHGCILGEGYRWCGQMATCIRPWEHGLKTEEMFAERCAKAEEALKCNCPPMEVIYSCTQEQHDRIMSGEACPFYRDNASPKH